MAISSDTLHLILLPAARKFRPTRFLRLLCSLAPSTPTSAPPHPPPPPAPPPPPFPCPPLRPSPYPGRASNRAFVESRPPVRASRRVQAPDTATIVVADDVLVLDDCSLQQKSPRGASEHEKGFRGMQTKAQPPAS